MCLVVAEPNYSLIDLMVHHVTFHKNTTFLLTLNLYFPLNHNNSQATARSGNH